MASGNTINLIGQLAVCLTCGAAVSIVGAQFGTRPRLVGLAGRFMMKGGRGVACVACFLLLAFVMFYTSKYHGVLTMILASAATLTLSLLGLSKAYDLGVRTYDERNHSKTVA